MISVSLVLFVSLSVIKCQNLTPTLRDAALKHGIFMGAATNYYDLHKDETYSTVGLFQFIFIIHICSIFYVQFCNQKTKQ